jgi:hypothetical protein
MQPSNAELNDLILRRKLVSITRENLSPNSQQGFLLSYSPELLLVRYVYDFHLDGLLLVRRKDITAINNGKTNQFQRTLLEAENLLSARIFQTNHSLDSFSSFLGGLAPNQIVIIEDETPDASDFYIGKLLSVGKKSIEIHEFTGAGNWKRNSETIDIARITCCQIETNYIAFYDRHFRRTN